MNTDRKIAMLVGVLFILGTTAGVLSVLVTQPLLSAPDYLTRISTHGNQLILGALLVLTMGLSLAVIPVVIYPVLRRYHPILALGYVVFRGALETVTYIALVTGWLLLIPLSQASMQAGAGEAAGIQALSSLLLKEAEISSAMTAIIFPLGALMLYAVLYQSKLIPRWLSVWGLIAVLLHLISTGLAGLFALTSPIPSSLDLLNLPIFLQEMVMALWLIVKGFRPVALTSQPAQELNSIDLNPAQL